VAVALVDDCTGLVRHFEFCNARCMQHVQVFSNPGMSLEQPEIDDAKRVDLL
jgi:hypothetical protein